MSTYLSASPTRNLTDKHAALKIEALYKEFQIASSGFAVTDRSLPKTLEDGVLIVGAGIAGLATAKALQKVFAATDVNIELA